MSFRLLRVDVIREIVFALLPVVHRERRLIAAALEPARHCAADRSQTDFLTGHVAPAGSQRLAFGQRTKSGRTFRDGAPQQCVPHRGETSEGLKTSDFAISAPVA
jgi:hypothetical protein